MIGIDVDWLIGIEILIEIWIETFEPFDRDLHFALASPVQTCPTFVRRFVIVTVGRVVKRCVSLVYRVVMGYVNRVYRVAIRCVNGFVSHDRDHLGHRRLLDHLIGCENDFLLYRLLVPILHESFWLTLPFFD